MKVDPNEIPNDGADSARRPDEPADPGQLDLLEANVVYSVRRHRLSQAEVVRINQAFVANRKAMAAMVRERMLDCAADAENILKEAQRQGEDEVEEEQMTVSRGHLPPKGCF